MKKILFYNLLATITLYTIVYLIVAFSYWELKNPLKWIIDIPTYTPEARFMILFFYSFYQLFQLGVILNWKEMLSNHSKYK